MDNMDKSTISMAIFNSYVSLPEGKHMLIYSLMTWMICGNSILGNLHIFVRIIGIIIYEIL